MPSLQNERKESIVETTRIKTPIRNYFIKDVTEEYFGQNSIMVSIDNPSEKRVMLGVFSPGEWRIIDYASEYSETEAVFKNIEPGSIYAPVLEKGNPDRLNYVVSHSYLKGMAQLLCLNLPQKRLNSPLTERCRLCLGFMTGFPKAYREAILN